MAFEHMKADEKAILQAALAKGLFPGTKVYDSKVGEGFQPTKGDFTAAELEMARNLTQKRIDCIEYTPAAITIIEVTPRLSSRSIGQVVTYKSLYSRKYEPVLPLLLAIVCSEADPDLLSVAAEQNITVHVV